MYADRQGLQGLGSQASTNDLSGQTTDVTNGNPLGTPFKNGQGLILKQDSANNNAVVQAAAATDLPVGVLANTPAAGDPAQIDSADGVIAMVLSGAAVTRGVRVVSDSNGRGIAYTSGTVYIVGVAMATVGAANTLFPVQLRVMQVAS